MNIEIRGSVLLVIALVGGALVYGAYRLGGHNALVAPLTSPSEATSALPISVWTNASTSPLRAVSSGADESFAVGERGAILRRSNGDVAWTTVPPTTDRTLYAVAQRGKDVLAAGDGVIVERDGDHWKLASDVPGLHGAVYSWMGPIVVGDRGAVGVEGPSGWRWETSGTQANLRSVCAGLTETIAVGQAGVVLRWAGGWKQDPSVTSEDLESVACDDSRAVAVGANGIVIVRENNAWRTIATSGARLYGVAATFGMRSWLAVGERGALVRSLGTEPTIMKNDLFGAAEGPQGELLVGAGGLFVHNLSSPAANGNN